MIFYSNIFDINLTKKTVFVLMTGLWLLIFSSTINAQPAGYGCDDLDWSNYGVNSNNDASSIQYDNFVNMFHGAIIRNPDGYFYTWGERMRPSNSPTNSSNDITTPEKIDNTFSSTLTGQYLMATGGSNLNNANYQAFILTTDGLFVWGKSNIVISSSLTSTQSVSKVSGGSNMTAKGLPSGVEPRDVKMLWATFNTLALLTCDGKAYVLSRNAYMRGAGSSATSSTTWYRVKTSASGNPDLENVIALRGASRAMMALTSDNKVYTWGPQVYLGDGSALKTNNSDNYYATQMTLPTTESGSIKMIQATTKGTNSTETDITISISTSTTYYILYANGHLWALGDGTGRQLGNWSTSNSNTWVQPKYPDTGNPSQAGLPMNDIVWISANEHDGTNSEIAAINTGKKMWNWGGDARSMLGRGDLSAMADADINGHPKNPGQPAFNDDPNNPERANRGEDFDGAVDNVLAISTGGHTIMLIKECSTRLGYMGHAVGGSAATGYSTDKQFPFTTFTSYIQVFGVETDVKIKLNIGIITDGNGDICTHQKVTVLGIPPGGILSLTQNPNNFATLIGNEITFDESKMSGSTEDISIHYEVEDVCGPVSIDTTFTITKLCQLYQVNGNVWIDVNKDAEYDSYEQGTNLSSGSYTGLYANLVDENDNVVQSVKVNADGSYNLVTVDGSQIYSIVITRNEIGIGIPIPSGQLNLPSGWLYTGNNDGTPHINPSEPYKISGIDFSFSNEFNDIDFGLTGTSSISGNVFHDPDGLSDGSITESNGNNNLGKDLTGVSVLLIYNNVVIATTTTNNGEYSFDELPDGPYTIILTSDIGISVGDNAPVSSSLPNGWVSTGEYHGVGTGDDTLVDGQLSLTLTGNETNLNFGLEQLPTAIGGVGVSQINPGGTNTVVVPQSLLGGTDPDGTVDNIHYISFPSNVTSIIIDNITYTSINWPSGGVTVPIGTIVEIDPISGSVTSEIPFRVIDNAGFESENTSSAEMPFIEGSPSIEIVKTGTYQDSDGVTGVSAGDEIHYTFTVTNTGNVTLTNVVVTDPKVTVAGGPISSMAPGAVDNSTFTATYVITQADINAGNVENTAEVSGKDPDNSDVTDVDTEDTPLGQTPSIDLVKSGTYVDADNDGVVSAGDEIHYTFTVTNTGNVTLTNVVVTDPKVTVAGGPISSMAPGAVDNSTFTATYVITQADINAGNVENTAEVSGKDPNNDDVTDVDTEDTPLGQSSSINLVKSGTYVDADNDGVVSAGDEIHYTFTVTNTGNVTLTNVVVTDPKVTVAGGPISSMAPGAVDNSTFTATYVITQADINAGNVENTAEVSGKDPNNDDVTDVDTEDTPLGQSSSINLVKSGTYVDADNDGVVSAGDEIHYTFTVTNTGNVTLTNVVVTDPKVTVAGGPISSMAPGAVDNSTFTATYVITQADINAGNVENTAEVSGKDPNNDDVTDVDTEDTPLGQSSSINLVKSGTYVDADNDGVVSAGDEIHYTFTVTNTGNVTLTNVVVTDPKVTVAGGPISSMAPGAVDNSTFTATYVITQADINAGNVENTAEVSGKDPNNDDVTDEDKEDTPLGQSSSINLVKSGTYVDADNDGVVSAGDEIHYTFTVTNTGNVTLTNVVVTDPKVTVAGGPISSMAPGAVDNSTFTATYVITQADINAGNVENTAGVSGKDPNNDDVTDEDTEDTPLGQTPSIDLVKSGTYVDADNDGVVSAGDEIHYTFTVTNTGNVTLTNVVVTDPKVTVAGGPISSMAPGAVDNSTFTATYVITQADINAGNVENTAEVSGKDPDNSDVTDVDTEDTPLGQTPSIDLVKSGTYVDADNDGVVSAGDEIHYTFTVTNTGNVTLTNVVVTDPKVTVAGGPISSMAPGAVDNSTFTATYVITQADINAGNVENTAGVSGKDPNNDDVTDEDTEDTPLGQSSSIDLVKSGTYVDADNDGVVSAGDEIHYTFTVTNTGNVTLTNVVVTDPKVSVAGGPISSMAPGAVDNSTFTATYIITQADINAGNVENTAEVSGKDPNNDDVTDVDTEDTPLGQTPSIDLVKSGTYVDADNDGVVSAGDEIHYTFTVTNTGNVTLTNVVVTDPKVTVAGGPISSMAPGAVDNSTFTATYVITQADINAGNVENTAEVSGKDPDNSDVTDVDTEDTPLGQSSSINLVKSGTYVDADNDGVVSAGDEIHYTFTVTNTGNVTLTNVVVTDPKVTVAGGPISSMAPGAVDNSTFTATYVITQADINAGNVENTAEVSGKDPDNSDVTDVDTEDTPLGQSSSIKLWKSGAYVDTNSDGIVNVGDHIHYNFTVKNTGNVTLTNVIVTDPKITVTGGPVTLIPGEVNSTTFSGLYAVKQSDIIAMGVYNLATTIGKDPSGNDVSDESEDPNPLDPNDQFYDPLCPDCTFVHLPWAVITAIDDNYGPYNSMDGGTTGSVLNNDYLNGNPVNPSDVTLTPGTPSDPTLSMNPNGTINVAPGTPTGTYTYPYTICEIINPTNCDDAVATITVISPDITAIEDNYGPYNSMDGGTTGSVLNNDYLNGNPVNPSDVTLTPGTPSDPALSMNPNGTINVAPGTPAGTYTYPYTICEIINPSNCDDAVATITVISPDITAIDDNYGPYNSMDGGTTGSVLNNDYLNGNPVNPSDVTLTPGTPSDPALSMNPNGTINVAPGTPAGTYTYPYTICEIINPTNCDDAVATITVISPDITAIDDNYGPYNSSTGGITGSVLNNDYLNGNPVNPSDVTLTPGTPSDPALSMNPNGTINVAPGTPAGTYTYPYTICEIINPTNCDDAVATVIITGVTTVCVVPNLQVLLEGPFKDKGDGQTMTTKLNNLGYLPGQKPVPFFGIPTPVGQPYGIAPWNYAGNEGINYDKSLQGPKAGYAADITDWVLVSLRETTSPSSTVCQKAALLHSDGTVEMISGFDCCEIDLNKQYYVVVEHRNHLIVMSHVKLPISNNSITYDFTSHQSYRGLLGNGQKIIDGKFVMFAGNGDQIETVSSVKDVNIKDKDLWLLHNGENSQYNINDFELNGDVNVQDKNMWLDNNSIFTDVPR